MTARPELHYRRATAEDLDRCTEIRGMTRDNPLDRQTLINIGVTNEAWAAKMAADLYQGFVAEHEGTVVGYCFGDSETGEVLVLALLPDYDGAGLGTKLLSLVSDLLRAAGHRQLWLAASSDPTIRAHGFYRHLGWTPSGKIDQHGDEILTLQLA